MVDAEPDDCTIDDENRIKTEETTIEKKKNESSIGKDFNFISSFLSLIEIFLKNRSADKLIAEVFTVCLQLSVNFMSSSIHLFQFNRKNRSSS